MKKYMLVTDATAAAVEEKTGLRGIDTPLGALVEHRDPVVEAIRFGLMRDALERRLNPQPRGCPECHGVILHSPRCKLGMAVT